MTDDLSHATRTVDWKAVIAALALTWTAILGAGNLLRSSILDAVDVRLAEHATASAESRRKFLGELELRSAGSLDRIGKIEINCGRFQDWRERIDRDIGALQGWRETAGNQLERLSYYVQIDDGRVDVLEARLDALKDTLRGGKP